MSELQLTKKDLFNMVKNLKCEVRELKKEIKRKDKAMEELKNFEEKVNDKLAIMDGDIAHFFSEIYDDLCEEHNLTPSQEVRDVIYSNIDEAISRILE